MGLYAGATRRFVAALVDAVIVGLLVSAAHAPLMRLAAGWIAPAALGAIVLAYFVLLPASPAQATPGQSALDIKVTTLEGERIGIARALVRFGASVVSAAVAMLGLFMADFDPRRRAFHDRLAGTLVVAGKATPAEVRAGGEPLRTGTRAMWLLGIAGVMVLVGALLALLVPAYRDSQARMMVYPALRSIGPIQEEVAAALLEDRTPVAGPRAPAAPGGPKITVASQGRITVQFSPRYDSGSAVYTPARTAQGVTWKCSASGLQRNWIPPECRD